jgi:hypothetical protein
MIAIIALERARDMRSEVWEAMGWPYELFLRFSQIPEERADANLAQVQVRMRASLRLYTPSIVGSQPGSSS